MSEACTQHVTHSRVKVEENKRKAVFLNPGNKKYSVITVDGCLITEGERSDYIVSETGNASVLVELKGRDVEHACQQLLTTVKSKEAKAVLEKKVGFLVICRKFPRFDTFVAKAKQKCAREHKAGFHVVCDQGEFDIEDVVAISGRVKAR